MTRFECEAGILDDGLRPEVAGPQRLRVRYRVRPHTFVSPSADSRRALVSYGRKYVHEVQVNRLGGGWLVISGLTAL